MSNDVTQVDPRALALAIQALQKTKQPQQTLDQTVTTDKKHHSTATDDSYEATEDRAARWRREQEARSEVQGQQNPPAGQHLNAAESFKVSDHIQHERHRKV